MRDIWRREYCTDVVILFGVRGWDGCMIVHVLDSTCGNHNGILYVYKG